MKKTIKILLNVMLVLMFMASITSFSVAKYAINQSTTSTARVAKYNITVTQDETWSNGTTDNAIFFQGVKTYSFTVRNQGESSARVRIVADSGTIVANPSGWFTLNADSQTTATVSVNAPVDVGSTNSASFHFEHEQID